MDAEVDEDALIARAQAGDEVAFAALVERYQARLYRLMVRACLHPQDAEEVASEAFTRAHDKLQQFAGRSRFISWVGRIATNLCLQRRERQTLPQVPLGDQPAAATDDTPEQAALRAETRAIVREAVESLPEPGRTVLVLRDIEQLSTAEACQQTGLGEAALKSQLHRARARLRERLDERLLATAC